MSDNNINQDIDLKNLEKKALTSTFQDGFFDIYLGIIFFGIGISSFISKILHDLLEFTILLVLVVIGFVIFFLGKKFITTPRLGFVKFIPRQKAEMKKVMLILFTFVSITLTILILTIYNLLQFEEYILPFVLGSFFAFPITLLAYYLKLNRLYLFAVLGGICFFMYELFYSIRGNPIMGSFGFLLVGSIIIFSGVILLIRFFRKYPVPKKEVLNNE